MAVSFTKQCLTCLKTSIKFISEKEWYLDVGDGDVSLRTLSEAEVFCANCGQDRLHTIIKRLESTPELLILTFKRNSAADIKLKYHVDLNSLKYHNGS